MSSLIQSARQWARKAGLGRLLRVVYYDPAAHVRTSVREGGPLEQRRTEASRREMEAAAFTLPVVAAPDGPDAEVHFLTGARFWYQTLFCAVSMQQQSPAVRVVPVLYDDGTLSEADVEAVQRVVPAARVVWRAEIEARLDAHLPAARFPALRARRLTYPHLRKLTDIHVGQEGWRLVLDSDMLFFRPPRLVLDWLAAPDRPLHMIDIEPSYGYSDELLAELAGGPVPELINVGFLGLRSDSLGWDRMEYACQTMIEREGTSYFQEQALSALLLAGQPCTVAPKEDYVVLPSLAEGARPTAILHHYVAESKRSYFQHGWRIVAGRTSP